MMKMNIKFEVNDEDGLNPSGEPIVFVFNMDIRYNAGKPDVLYIKNGDPGYPGASAEIDILNFNCISQTGRAQLLDQKVANEWFARMLNNFPDLVDEITNKCSDLAGN